MKNKDFFQDLLAGLTVSFAAIALGAAFGVMSGRGAFSGMIAAAVIPIFTGLFGGTRLSVSGPTAPMTAVSSLVVAFAYENFQDKILAEQFITLVFILTGILLVVSGALRLGKFIEYVPNVVILGFMSGIALLIWIDQFKVIFGLGGKVAPEGDLFVNIALALITFILILIFPAITKKVLPRNVRHYIPFTLTVIALMTVITSVFNISVGKIKLGDVGGSVVHLAALAKLYFPSGEIFTMQYILKALPYAFELCLLGYLDSLLTALIMDKLTCEKSNYNKELFGQGLSNLASAVAMGIPGAQATIRSVLLFKEGAKTRLGAVSAGIFVFLLFLVFKDFVTLITSAVFIGVLLKAAYDVFEKDFLKTYFSKKWYRANKYNIQLCFIFYTMLCTALFDLNMAVITGTIFFYIGKKFWNISDVISENINEED